MAKYSANFGVAKTYDLCVLKHLLVELRSSSQLHRKTKLSYVKIQWAFWNYEPLDAKMMLWTAMMRFSVASYRQFKGKDE